MDHRRRHPDLTEPIRTVEVSESLPLPLPCIARLRIDREPNPTKYVHHEPSPGQGTSRRCPCGCGGEEQASDSVGVAQDETQSDPSSHRVANHHGCVHSRHVEKTGGVVCHLFGRIANVRFLAPAGSSRIEDQHLIPLSEGRNDRREHPRVGSQTGDHRHRRSPAMQLVVQLDPVHACRSHGASLSQWKQLALTSSTQPSPGSSRDAQRRDFG